MTSKCLKKLQKCTAKPSSLLVYDLTLSSDNPMHFKQHLLERQMIKRLDMKNYNMVLIEKQQKC